MTPNAHLRWYGILFVVVTVTVAGWMLQGRGYRAVVMQHAFPRHPAVRGSRPAAMEANVDPGAFVAVDVALPNTGKGVDKNTLVERGVSLTRADDGRVVPAVVNTSGGGDVVVLQPIDPLEPHTRYVFNLSRDLRDTGGASFRPYRATFTTGADQAAIDFPGGFEKVPLPQTVGMPTIGLTIGPDHRLYATTVDGRILRYDIRPDGTLGPTKLINIIQRANWGPRMVPGIAFDPASTPDRLVAWVTHAQFSFDNGDDWTGKLSRLSGPNLETYQDYIVGLPRSIRDHITATPVFGPDGALYFGQPSNSAMGSPDPVWGNRAEHLLNATILRFDPAKVVRPPLDAKTEGPTAYDPLAADAPLTLYATGLRNAFDFVFHSGGGLFAPSNGSAAGGGVGGYAGETITGYRTDAASRGPYLHPRVPALANVEQTMPDYLYRVERGGYYGHPNAARNEFVLNGGNPTAGADPAEVPAYPVGTQPDRNYRPPVYDFGQNASPNAIIEYRGDAFGGAMKGMLLACRYSGGDDIVALAVGRDGSIVRDVKGIVGLTQFVDPLGLVEDVTNGNLYVAEFGAQRVTLLRPLAPGVHALAEATRLLFTDCADGQPSVAQKVSIRNVGTAPLEVDPTGATITGPDAPQFTLVAPPNGPVRPRQGRSADLLVAFNAAPGTPAGIKIATISIPTNDPAHPLVTCKLRGLATAGASSAGNAGVAEEPSLQRVLELYEMPVTVGDPDPGTADLGYAPVSPNDEVTAQRLEKVLPDPVTIRPLACFGPAGSPVLRLAWYHPKSTAAGGAGSDVFSIPASDNLGVSPTAIGGTTFEPGDEPFALSTTWPGLKDRRVYSEDARNTDQADTARRRAFRFYRLKNADGTPVPHAYVVAVEATTAAADQQDFVGIIQNVKPARGK